MPEYTLSLLIWILPVIAFIVILYRKRIVTLNELQSLLISIPIFTIVGFSLDLLYAEKFFTFPNHKTLVGISFYNIPIEEFVNLADAVVLPYNSMVATEGNPSCILESMACKTPVITANLPELKETFNGDVIMTDVRNSSNLAKHIKMVLNQKNEKMIEQAYKKTQKFSSENIAKAMLKLYQE